MTEHICRSPHSHMCTCDIGRDHSDSEHRTAMRQEADREMTAQKDAADTVARAIEKLEALRSTAFAGPWTAFHSGVANGDHSYVIAENESIAYISANDGIDEEYRAPTAELIATLHRTIDAQRAVLRAAAQHINHNRGAVSHSGPGIELARAILGEEAAA